VIVAMVCVKFGGRLVLLDDAARDADVPLGQPDLDGFLFPRPPFQDRRKGLPKVFSGC